MYAANESQSPGGIRPRFTLKLLLQGMTLLAFAIALLSQGPMWLLYSVARVVSVALWGSLVALAFLQQGRVRIACVAALTSYWPNSGMSSMVYFPQTLGLSGLQPRFALIVGLIFVWGGVAIAGATAYWVAGWFSRKAEPASSEDS